MNPRRAALFHRREEMHLPPDRKKEAAGSGGLDVLILRAAAVSRERSGNRSNRSV
jgi:hypothetical protein